MTTLPQKIIFSLLLCALLLSCFTGCTEQTSDPEDFEALYLSHYSASPNMLSFSQYAYSSYLLLFPRTEPTEPNEFFHFFRPSFGFDKHLFYFSYTLERASYLTLSEEMRKFQIESEYGTNTAIFDPESFSYPAVILSFPGKDEARSAPFEYLLLDDANLRIISVFALNIKDSKMAEFLPREYLPADMETVRSSLSSLVNNEGNYSFYCFTDSEGNEFTPTLGDLRYVDLFHTKGIEW